MNAVMKQQAQREALLADAFPEVELNFKPFGSNVLLQVKSPKRKSAGGIALIEEARETEKWNTQVAKVVALGPLAFHNRTDLRQWPEGEWCKVGDYVRCSKYGGDRWEIPIPGREEYALFALCRDTDLLGAVEDPLAVLAYIN